jgi:hypothetical protein
MPLARSARDLLSEPNSPESSSDRRDSYGVPEAADTAIPRPKAPPPLLRFALPASPPAAVLLRMAELEIVNIGVVAVLV